MIRIEFELTRRDWELGTWIHRRRNPANRDPLRGLTTAGALAAAFGFLLWAKRPDGGGWVSPAALIAFGMFVPIRLILIRHAAAADAWAKSERQIQPTALALDDGGVRITSAHVDATYQWAEFERWAEGSSEFLLYRSAEQFYVIPKRAFANEADVAEFRRLLNEHVVDLGAAAERARGFPVLPAKR